LEFLPEFVSPALAALCAFAFLAGFIDSVVGGGGLIQIPALMLLMPGTPVVALLGTNKFASVWGTLAATTQYLRRVPLPRNAALPACAAAFVFGLLGARAAAALPADVMRPLVLVLLLLVLAYTLWRKDFGRLHAPRLAVPVQRLVALAVGAAIGFYDGFFGPGTGSFLIFAFVGLFGFDFLAASAAAKLVNLVTNLAALAYFMPAGHVLYELALPMALFNVAGAIMGARLAIRRGSGFVRGLFLLVVGALVLRLGMDLLRAA
jgi:uncharacterized membrane protein YfcA